MAENEQKQTAINIEELDRIENSFEQIEIENQAAPNVEPEIPTEQILFPVVSFATAIICPNWEIAESENMKLAEAYGALLDKYFPNVGDHFGVELNALLITAAIFAPRIGKPTRIVEQVEAESPDKTDKTEKAVIKTPPEMGILSVVETVNGQMV